MNSTKKHSIHILTLAIIMIVFSGCSLKNISPSSSKEESPRPPLQEQGIAGKEEVEEVATSSQEGLDSGSEDNSISNEIDTSEWKTYRNEEYGFEIKYPGDWNFTNYSEQKNGYLLSFMVYNKANNSKPYFLFNIPEIGRGAESFDSRLEEDFYFNNQKLKKIIYTREKIRSIYVSFRDPKNNWESGFEFSYNIKNEKKALSIFDHMLATVEFL